MADLHAAGCDLLTSRYLGRRRAIRSSAGSSPRSSWSCAKRPSRSASRVMSGRCPLVLRAGRLYARRERRAATAVLAGDDPWNPRRFAPREVLRRHTGHSPAQGRLAGPVANASPQLRLLG